MFTIQTAFHSIKGDNSKCFFPEFCSFELTFYLLSSTPQPSIGTCMQCSCCFFSLSFLSFPNRISIFEGHLICHLQMLSIWPCIKFCLVELNELCGVSYEKGKKFWLPWSNPFLTMFWFDRLPNWDSTKHWFIWLRMKTVCMAFNTIFNYIVTWWPVLLSMLPLYFFCKLFLYCSSKVNGSS